jgi:hypothetical protein
LKFVHPALVLLEKTIIVGSSPNLVGSGLGSTIDSFDDVVRFNRAPTDGYQIDIGSKTTLRVANTHVVLNMPMGENWNPIGQPTDFIKNLRNSRLVCWGNFEGYDLKYHIDHNNSIYMTDFTDPMFPGNVQTVVTRFSVGFGFIMVCVVSGFVPHICGFMVGNKGLRGHYWEKAGPESDCHDRLAERIALTKLCDEGKVIILS